VGGVFEEVIAALSEVVDQSRLRSSLLGREPGAS
jgi:hypothetical protein